MTTSFNPHYTIPGYQSLRICHLTCWVQAEGRPKVIGSPERSSRNDVFTCWIESKAGQQFSVHWHNNRRDQSLEGRLYIDGMLCDTHLLPDGRLRPESHWATVNLNWAQITEFTRSNFFFSDVTQTKEDTKMAFEINPNEIGSVKLEVRRAVLTSTAPMIDSAYEGQMLDDRVPEGLLPNDISHRTKFGPAYEHAPSQLMGAKGKVLDENPVYTFVFKYRPLEYLLEHNLIPLQFLRAPSIHTKIRSFSYNLDGSPYYPSNSMLLSTTDVGGSPMSRRKSHDGHRTCSSPRVKDEMESVVVVKQECNEADL